MVSHDRLATPDNPENKLTAVQHLVRRTLLSDPGLLPHTPLSELTALVNDRTLLLDDETFEDALFPPVIHQYFPQYIKDAKQSGEAAQINVALIPGTVPAEDTIIARRRFIARRDIDPEYSLAQIYLEELAHAFSLPTELTPFTTLRDNTWSLAPHQTKTAFLHALEKQRRTQFGFPDRVNPKRIRVRSRGFHTTCYEHRPETKGELVPYAPDQVQNDLEEVRAIIVQTVFTMKHFGALAAPFAPTSHQLLYGLRYLHAHHAEQGRTGFYSKQVAGLVFISDYLTSDNVGSMRDLLARLYSMDLDEFFIFLRDTKPNLVRTLRFLITQFAGDSFFPSDT